jgi:cell division protein FtsZ
MRPRIAVIGVGGAGGNAVNNMIAAGLTGAHRPSVSAKPPAARELILKTTRACRLGMIRFPAMAC